MNAAGELIHAVGDWCCWAGSLLEDVCGECLIKLVKAKAYQTLLGVTWVGNLMDSG